MPVDPCFAELLADKRSELRPPPPHVTIDDMRAGNKAYLAATPKVAIHDVEDRVIEGGDALKVRIYRPSAAGLLPATLFCHGGGFVLGDLDTHDSICHRLARSAQRVVVAVDYRRAPEHPFPVPYQDCVAALRWMAANAGALGIDERRLTVCGDSAGANLALAVANSTRSGGGPAISHVGLLYPMADPSCRFPSMTEFARGYLLSAAAVKWCWGLYLGAAQSSPSPLAAPLEGDLAGLPPVSIAVAEFDPLRDEGEALAAKMQAAGVAVTMRRYAGMVHGFAGLAHLTKVAVQAIDDLARDIAAVAE